MINVLEALPKSKNKITVVYKGRSSLEVSSYYLVQ